MTFFSKICLLGDGAVGKTALKKKYLGEGFTSSYMMTIGADFSTFAEEISGKTVKFQIWDLAGQERFQSVRAMYYTGSQGLVMVFDVTRLYTFRDLEEKWLNEIFKNIQSGPVPMILIGNKIDLREKDNPNHVTYNQGCQLAKRLSEKYTQGKINIQYVETSAKTGENVKKAFVLLEQDIQDYQSSGNRSTRTFLKVEDESKVKDIIFHSIEIIFNPIPSLTKYLKSVAEVSKKEKQINIQKEDLFSLISNNKEEFSYFFDKRNFEFNIYDSLEFEEKKTLLDLIIALANCLEDWLTNYYERFFQEWIFLFLEFLLIKSISESLASDEKKKNESIFDLFKHFPALVKCYYFFKQKNSKRAKTLALIILMLNEFSSLNTQDFLQSYNFNDKNLFLIFQEIKEDKDADIQLILRELTDFAREGHYVKFYAIKNLFLNSNVNFLFSETQKEVVFLLLKALKTLISPIRIEFRHILKSSENKEDFINVELRVGNDSDKILQLEIQLDVQFINTDNISSMNKEITKIINVEPKGTNNDTFRTTPKGNGLHILQLTIYDVNNNYIQYSQGIIYYQGSNEKNDKSNFNEKILTIWKKNLYDSPNVKEIPDPSLLVELFNLYKIILSKNNNLSENIDEIYQNQLCTIFKYFFHLNVVSNEPKPDMLERYTKEFYKLKPEHIKTASKLIHYKLANDFYTANYDTEIIFCELGLLLKNYIINYKDEIPVLHNMHLSNAVIMVYNQFLVLYNRIHANILEMKPSKKEIQDHGGKVLDIKIPSIIQESLLKEIILKINQNPEYQRDIISLDGKNTNSENFNVYFLAKDLELIYKRINDLINEIK